ncbi:hypothetical protein M5D96_013728, partial [Drosophila gunungcola]
APPSNTRTRIISLRSLSAYFSLRITLSVEVKWNLLNFNCTQHAAGESNNTISGQISFNLR